MAKIISPTLLAAQAAYMKEHGINLPEDPKKMELPVVNKKPFVEGLSNDKNFSIYMESISQVAFMPVLTYMNDRDIVTALLKRYESTLNHLKTMSDFDRMCNFVFTQKVFKGVCLCARQVFGVDITNQDWMSCFLRGNHVYWHRVPYNCENSGQIIDAIEFRVNKLKEVLKGFNESDSEI